MQCFCYCNNKLEVLSGLIITQTSDAVRWIQWLVHSYNKHLGLYAMCCNDE